MVMQDNYPCVDLFGFCRCSSSMMSLRLNTPPGGGECSPPFPHWLLSLLRGGDSGWPHPTEELISQGGDDG